MADWWKLALWGGGQGPDYPSGGGGDLPGSWLPLGRVSQAGD